MTITENLMHRSWKTPRVRMLCLALVSLEVLGGCRDHETPSEAVATGTAASAERVAEFMPALTDVSMRILPSLADAKTAQLLATQLGDLQNALGSHDGSAAARQLAALRGTIAAYPPELYPRDAAELDAIEVTLNHMAQLTGRATRPVGVAP